MEAGAAALIASQDFDPFGSNEPTSMAGSE